MQRVLPTTIFLLTLLTVWVFVSERWRMPNAVSDFGKVYDPQFKLTMIVIGIAFVVFQVILGLIIWRGNSKTGSVKDSLKVEIAWTFLTAIVFFTLAFFGQRIWTALLKPEIKTEVFKIEVTAQQFQWNFHYAGKDKIFGRTKAELINDSELNYIGLDKTDANAKDDIVSSVLVVPVNQAVELTMKSRDVTHSFWVAPLRFKQDLVPGLTTKISFRPMQTGTYEIACAELCGVSHYKMKSYLLIVTEEETEKLMLLSQEEFQTRVLVLLNQ